MAVHGGGGSCRPGFVHCPLVLAGMWLIADYTLHSVVVSSQRLVVVSQTERQWQFSAWTEANITTTAAAAAARQSELAVSHDVSSVVIVVF